MGLRLFLILAILWTAAPARAEPESESVHKVLQDVVRKNSAPKAVKVKPQAKPAAVAKAKPVAPALPDMQTSKNVSYGDDPAQVMDVYAPYGSGSAAVLVVIQNMQWTDNSGRAMDAKIRHWTRKGLIFVSLKTRTLPGTDIPGQAEDIARAVFYLKQNLKRWGGDADHIAVIGYDAGAHLLMLSASDPSINRGVTWQGSIALDSPVYDASSVMLGRPTEIQKQVFGQDSERWSQLSPYVRINGPAAPSLLVCSSQVRDACLQAEKYETKSRRQGNSVTLMPVEKDHIQMDADLGAPGAYTDAIDAFLKQVDVLP